MTGVKYFIISFFIVGTLAGIPHYFAKDTTTETEILNPYENLEGKWSATFKSTFFKGIIHYKFNKENNSFYITRVIEENGTDYRDNSLSLELKEYNGTSGKGIYHYQDEKVKEKIKCEVTFKSPNKLKVIYNYKGYPITETWTKLKQ
ncbi:hypothetical protein [Aureivirga marina]|uniref:hypothetical protein n=1 Tax=Aureivirga marina TaxID=1182451 RepID=UPI0018CB317C|nr:hypothetical protein [Aureivirga marina]